MPEALSITASSVDPGLLVPSLVDPARRVAEQLHRLPPQGPLPPPRAVRRTSPGASSPSRRRPRRWPAASTTCSATCIAWTPPASSASRSSPGGRMPRASRFPPRSSPRTCKFSLPYRALFTQVLRPDTANRLVDALAVLLVRLHNVGLLLGRRLAVEHALPPRRRRLRRVPRRRRDRRAPRGRPHARPARARPRHRPHQHRRRDHGSRGRRASRGRGRCPRDRRRHHVRRTTRCGAR